MIAINGDGHIFGRLASEVAKLLISGEEVSIVNSEKILVTGASYKKMVFKRNIGSDHWGPFYPVKPRMMIKRAVRGMLPKNFKGRMLLKKLRTHDGVPQDLQKVKFAEMMTHEHIKEHMSVGDVARLFKGDSK